MLVKQLTLSVTVTYTGYFSLDNSVSVGVPEICPLTSHAVSLHALPEQFHILSWFEA